MLLPPFTHFGVTVRSKAILEMIALGIPYSENTIIQFNLFPAHINISYNIDNVHIMCRKRGGLKTVLMKGRL